MARKAYLIVLIGVIACFAVPGRLLAETAEGGGEELFNQIRQLERLKTENPSGYQEAIAQKRTTLRERMTALRSQDPARFDAFLARQARNRRERMQFLKQNHPQEFRRFMAARMERFERLSAENPEAAEKFLAKHPGLKERMEQFRLKRREFARGKGQEVGPGFPGPRTGDGGEDTAGSLNRPGFFAGRDAFEEREPGESFDRGADSRLSGGRMPAHGGRPGIRQVGEFSEDRGGGFQRQREARERPGGRRGDGARRQRPQ